MKGAYHSTSNFSIKMCQMQQILITLKLGQSLLTYIVLNIHERMERHCTCWCFSVRQIHRTGRTNMWLVKFASFPAGLKCPMLLPILRILRVRQIWVWSYEMILLIRTESFTDTDAYALDFFHWYFLDCLQGNVFPFCRNSLLWCPKHWKYAPRKITGRARWPNLLVCRVRDLMENSLTCTLHHQNFEPIYY